MNGAFRARLRVWLVALAWTFAFSGPVRAQGVRQLSAERVLATHVHATVDGAPVVSSVAIDAAATWIATAGDDHWVRVWNAADGALARELSDHHDWVRAVSFAPSGQQLASAGDDHRLDIWNLATGRLLHCIPCADDALYAVAYSPDGRLLAAAGFCDRVQ
ncbi:MAG: WD40 repeat domain-containing protein, partial [Pirellulales bacterium]